MGHKRNRSKLEDFFEKNFDPAEHPIRNYSVFMGLFIGIATASILIPILGVKSCNLLCPCDKERKPVYLNRKIEDYDKKINDINIKINDYNKKLDLLIEKIHKE